MIFWVDRALLLVEGLSSVASGHRSIHLGGRLVLEGVSGGWEDGRPVVLVRFVLWLLGHVYQFIGFL